MLRDGAAHCRVGTEHVDLAAAGASQSQHQLHQCGLASTIMANQHYAFTGLDIETDIGYHGFVAVAFFDSVQ